MPHRRANGRIMKTLTIVTPTYNREELLKKAYDSLVGQTCSDFLWLIVDDGSTDGTEDLVRGFIEEGRVRIRYIKKENGGKHTALNVAFKEVETELIALCLDSDDEFTPNAVEEIVSLYNKTEKKYSGYVFIRTDLSSCVDDSLEVMSWQEAVSAERFLGETIIVLKSEYAKKFSFPVIEGEKFFTEGYVWLQMTEPFYWSRTNICRGTYLDDGYSKNIMKVFAASPKSHMMYNDLRLTLWKKPLKRFKFAAYYDGFAMLAREKGFVGKASSKALAALALIPGLIFYIILKRYR